MQTFAQFISEAVVDSKGKPLEVNTWYFYSKGNKGKGKKIYILSVDGDTFKYKEENADDVYKVPASTYKSSFAGYLTKAKAR